MNNYIIELGMGGYVRYDSSYHKGYRTEDEEEAFIVRGENDEEAQGIAIKLFSDKKLSMGFGIVALHKI